MDKARLITIKEVAAWAGCPAHRIIHLCEQGIVRPSVDSKGRGSMRRFNREEVFRVVVAIKLQDAGIPAPNMLPLMNEFDQLKKTAEMKALKPKLEDFDLVAAIGHWGNYDDPVMAILAGKSVDFHIPGLKISRMMPSINNLNPLAVEQRWTFCVAVFVNLTNCAELLL